MGYRSEVALATRKQDFKILKNLAKENQIVLDFIDEADIKADDDIVILHWDWVKWYSDYPEIKAIDKFLDKLREKDAPYKFIRIGESAEDVEVDINYGNEDEYGEDITERIDTVIEVNRSVNIDF